MENTFSCFLLGLLCTSMLFVLCLLIVVGAKMVLLAIKEKYFKKPQPIPVEPPKPTPVKRTRRKAHSSIKPVRSIEIDPEQVDKIYVKKIS